MAGIGGLYSGVMGGGRGKIVKVGSIYRKSGIVLDAHNKRQATQHGCLPSLLGDVDKGIEIVYGEEKNILYTGPTRAAKAE